MVSRCRNNTQRCQNGGAKPPEWQLRGGKRGRPAAQGAAPEMTVSTQPTIKTIQEQQQEPPTKKNERNRDNDDNTKFPRLQDHTQGQNRNKHVLDTVWELCLLVWRSCDNPCERNVAGACARSLFPHACLPKLPEFALEGSLPSFSSAAGELGAPGRSLTWQGCNEQEHNIARNKAPRMHPKSWHRVE